MLEQNNSNFPEAKGSSGKGKFPKEDWLFVIKKDPRRLSETELLFVYRRKTRSKKKSDWRQPYLARSQTDLTLFCRGFNDDISYGFIRE